jgi:hypothetical protein
MLLAQVAQAGQAILFIFALVGVAIVACYTLGYAGVSLLNVMQETAAGAEELAWPDEPLPDKAGRAFYFGTLLVVVLIPVGILTRALREDLFPDDRALRFLVLALPGLWLLLPIALLSSLSAANRWLVFRPVILARLLRLFPSTVAFYLTSAGLAALTGFAWYKALSSDYGLYVLPVAAVLSGWLWLLYSRLLGRLAFLIGQLGPLAAGSEREEAPTPIDRPRKRKKTPTSSRDPWAAPKGSDAEVDPRPVIAEGEVVEPYLLGNQEKPVYPDADLLAGKVPESSEDKAERLERKRRRLPPSRTVPAGEGLSTLFRGLATFPGQGKTLGVLVYLTFSFLALGGGVMALVALYPG